MLPTASTMPHGPLDTPCPHGTRVHPTPHATPAAQAELTAAMRSLGACEADAEQMLQALDADADGRIDFSEFCACASPLYTSSATALRRAFDFFDSDG